MAIRISEVSELSPPVTQTSYFWVEKADQPVADKISRLGEIGRGKVWLKFKYG